MTRLWWHSASDKSVRPSSSDRAFARGTAVARRAGLPACRPNPSWRGLPWWGCLLMAVAHRQPQPVRPPPRRGRDAKRAALGRGRRHASCAPCQPRTASVAVCRMASTGRRSRPRWACPLSSAQRPQTESDSASRSGACCGRTPGLDSRPCRRRSTRADRRLRVRLALVPLCAEASRRKKNQQAAQGVGNHRAAATAAAAPNRSCTPFASGQSDEATDGWPVRRPPLTVYLRGSGRPRRPRRTRRDNRGTRSLPPTADVPTADVAAAPAAAAAAASSTPVAAAAAATGAPRRRPPRLLTHLPAAAGRPPPPPPCPHLPQRQMTREGGTPHSCGGEGNAVDVWWTAAGRASPGGVPATADNTAAWGARAGPRPSLLPGWRPRGSDGGGATAPHASALPGRRAPPAPRSTGRSEHPSDWGRGLPAHPGAATPATNSRTAPAVSSSTAPPPSRPSPLAPLRSGSRHPPPPRRRPRASAARPLRRPPRDTTGAACARGKEQTDRDGTTLPPLRA